MARAHKTLNWDRTVAARSLIAVITTLNAQIKILEEYWVFLVFLARAPQAQVPSK